MRNHCNTANVMHPTDMVDTRYQIGRRISAWTRREGVDKTDPCGKNAA